MTVTVKDIGLAAYMKANGAVLTEFRQGAFRFITDQSLTQWRYSYTNSCCRRHDVELIELRRLTRLTVA